MWVTSRGVNSKDSEPPSSGSVITLVIAVSAETKLNLRQARIRLTQRHRRAQVKRLGQLVISASSADTTALASHHQLKRRTKQTKTRCA